MPEDDRRAAVDRYPLLDALRDRRSRRFGVGMEMASGALSFRSRRPARRLSEEEEALLAFAACGLTGPALLELDFTPGEGGAIVAGLQGRTVPSGDAIHSVAVVVTNEDATYLLRRPQDFPSREIPELVEMARAGEFTELYRRSRVQIETRRCQPPTHPMVNLSVNRWSLYDPASSYFLPVNEMTLLYINGVLEILGEDTGAFLVDERAGFRPAGIGRFAKSRGGHLHDDPADERVLTVQQVESLVTEFVSIEQGMILQNLGLMSQALGLGGFPHWAAHPFGWPEALGFRMAPIRTSRYLGMGRALGLLARVLGRDPVIEYGVGLEHDGHSLLTPFSPPYFPTMEAAVRAVVEVKFGAQGALRGGVEAGAWKHPDRIASCAQPPSQLAIEATVAYCDYLWRRYGRFPVYQPPLRTVLGFQVSHLDPDFYAEHYGPGALSPTQLRATRDGHPSSG